MGQKGSKPQITKTDKAILELKRSKDNIHKFTRRTDQLILEERQSLKLQIKENPDTYKNNAKIRFLLKRIHYQEDLVQKASDQLINLENMVSNIEFKLVEKQFIEGLKIGNDILTKMNKEFNNVSELMDDVQNQIDYQNEIDNVLSTSIVGIDNYEDELDKELDQLQSEVNPVPMEIADLPSTKALPQLARKESEELTEPLEQVKEPEPQKIGVLES